MDAFLANGNTSSTSSLDAFAWNSSHFNGTFSLSPEDKNAVKELADIIKGLKLRLVAAELLITLALTFGYFCERREYRKLESMLSELNNRGNSMADNLRCLANTILSGATRSHFIGHLFIGTLNAISVTMWMRLTEISYDPIFTAADDIEFIEFIESICHCHISFRVVEPRKTMLKLPFYKMDGLILLFYCCFVSIFCIYSYISLLWSTFQVLFPTRQVEILRKKCANANINDLLLVVGELGTGNWVLLHSVSQNIDSELFHDLILTLTDRVKFGELEMGVNEINSGL
ncbi:hypothetical protein AVEN_236278-1 [Araneus ventricosus]|uniref:Uncharacterized protein n=1 Tax=Araneus ventricosus TaxID=182803 RepID=A0A4Y2V582_ARAVE|nr:hypothetical protein AVEN_23113-1 [Araneus ventricosus]GBO19046.1 hypothetical protein AVEN_185212-1 [Araneus ventricosus]GBO19698.1 hypothetical protein AVEN_173634-1 [Araneus ventricosus]GBO19714.1 hypothetical protein AVEN_236278-1 [Araneus ventricosus]